VRPREDWIAGKETGKLGHALDHLYDDQGSTTDPERTGTMTHDELLEEVERYLSETETETPSDAWLRLSAATADAREDDDTCPRHPWMALRRCIIDQDSTPEFVKDDERLGWGAREDGKR
jgi:hypothetical protein